MMKKKVRRWIRPYLRKNRKGCKKEFSKVRGHFIMVEIEIPSSTIQEALS